MSSGGRDLLSTLERLAEEKRSGRLKLTGSNWSASILLRAGVVASVSLEPESSWRLGEILRHVRVLSPQRYRRAARVARKSGGLSAAAYILSKGWVVDPVYRRFQERLCVERIIELAPRAGYRAVFNALEEGAEPFSTEVAIPVPFVLGALSERHRESMMDEAPLPRGELCFRKTGAAIAHIFGGKGDDLPEGTPLLGLTAADRRVFFFCNGEVPFQDLSLVLGLSPYQLGQSLRKLIRLNAVYQASGDSRWAIWARGLRKVSRPFFAFLGGISVVAVVLVVASATLSAIEDTGRRAWSFEKSRYYVSGMGVVRRSVEDALHAHYLSYGIYPESLLRLVDSGHFSSDWLHRQVLRRDLDYERDLDERGCRLSVAGKEMVFRWGRFRPVDTQEESKEGR